MSALFTLVILFCDVVVIMMLILMTIPVLA
jgi:hypothetical protein